MASGPIYWVHQPVKGMKHRMKWCELPEYKWNEYVTIACAVKRNLCKCKIAPPPKKKFFESRWGPRKTYFRAISQLLKLRFTAMVTYSFHLYSRSSHHCKKKMFQKVKKKAVTGNEGLNVEYLWKSFYLCTTDFIVWYLFCHRNAFFGTSLRKRFELIQIFKAQTTWCVVAFSVWRLWKAA